MANKLVETEDTSELKKRIINTAAKKYFYQKSYQKYTEILNRCPQKGLAIELGSGAGLTKYFISEFITTDVILFPELDCVIDGKTLPFKNDSIRLFCMLNVFHHISDVELFLSEVSRCLAPQGRILMIDQHIGLISRWILKYLHNENYDDKTNSWTFESSNPVTDANGALTWIVFRRDLKLFQKKYPELKLIKYKPHTPLFYWLSGGLKKWNLIPKIFIPLAIMLDKFLLRITNDFGSFVDIELVKNVDI
ncbi:MAG TPA: methyltransferase domain-containing protein [Thiotrichaceae bacterium]|jgi:SAM-dependent methyltransferase|nr:methyltransferase domain-containing protein [Thiotrichaceae bacterium]